MIMNGTVHQVQEIRVKGQRLTLTPVIKSRFAIASKIHLHRMTCRFITAIITIEIAITLSVDWDAISFLFTLERHCIVYTTKKQKWSRKLNLEETKYLVKTESLDIL